MKSEMSSEAKGKILHQRTRSEFEAMITLPASHFILYPDRVRLTYIKDGHTRHWNLFPRELAAMLKDQGIIKFYSITRQSVTMYQTSLITLYNEVGAPYQTEIPVPLKWEDISFSPYEVIRFCAEREWSKTVGPVVTGLFNTINSIKNAI